MTLSSTRSELSIAIYGERNTETFEGKEWQRVTSNINWVGSKNKLWVSLGSTEGREIILFNEHISKIDQIKRNAQDVCYGKTIPQILTVVTVLVNNFTAIDDQAYPETEKALDNRFQNFLNEYHSRFGETIAIHMEEFLNARILVCRHKALLAAALLRHLVEQKILPFGSVRQYRSSIMRSDGEVAHTWAIYRDYTQGDVWICDPRWRVMANMRTNWQGILPKYTEPVLNLMMQRLDAQDVYLPFQEKVANSIAAFVIKIQAFQSSDQHFPGLQIGVSFNKGDRSINAFGHALSIQKIKFTVSDTFIYIPLAQNPAIFNFDMKKLIADYQILQDILSSAEPQAQPEVTSDPKLLLFTISSDNSGLDKEQNEFKDWDWDSDKLYAMSTEEKDNPSFRKLRKI